jgi:DNA-binding NarL/FixJ family response regulator
VSIRVLIVDDVWSLRELFKVVVENDPRFEVVGEASDGQEAIEMARLHRPDIVMLDLAMPNMDGLRAIPLIHGAAPGVHVIVLSAFDGEGLIALALARCATAFLIKGASSEHIVKTMHAVSQQPAKKLCLVASDEK